MCFTSCNALSSAPVCVCGCVRVFVFVREMDSLCDTSVLSFSVHGEISCFEIVISIRKFDFIGRTKETNCLFLYSPFTYYI